MCADTCIAQIVANDSKLLLDGSFRYRKNQVIPFVKEHDFDVLIVLGAGDLDNQVPELARILKDKYSL